MQYIKYDVGHRSGASPKIWVIVLPRFSINGYGHEKCFPWEALLVGTPGEWVEIYFIEMGTFLGKAILEMGAIQKRWRANHYVIHVHPPVIKWREPFSKQWAFE